MVKVTSLLPCYCLVACLGIFYHQAVGFCGPLVLSLSSSRATAIGSSTTITTSLHLHSSKPSTTIPYFATATTSSDRKPSSSSSISSSDTTNVIGERNGLDSDYPWRFEGRFIFRPSIVRTNDQSPQSATLLSLLGYSLGGTVVLEYDISPVGPYREYVTMGGLVGMGTVDIGGTDNMNTDMQQSSVLGIGQWGTNLYVSTQVAEDVCKHVWGVPAQLAIIDFEESGDTLEDYEPASDTGGSGQGMMQKCLRGWENTRILNRDATTKRYGNLPIYWTPTIKALWAPILFPGRAADTFERKQLLPLHKLRLSAGAIRLKRCHRQVQSTTVGEVPLGFALVVDGVLIEIGERITSRLKL
ncbi:hypothetical protein ACHAWU_006600 [Discostella pseudostelligera]|uniref:Uncharacterized protein n=1 Tax=Discostella pseudostelligera TaxID=259834 RepID=A0ABD3M8X1_9STRA